MSKTISKAIIVYNPLDPRTPRKVCLTDNTLNNVIMWFHYVLRYSDKRRNKDGMYLFHHPLLHNNIKLYDMEAS